jgi:metal-responsive CopG/Arc/MetJ family transcriptional regulator
MTENVVKVVLNQQQLELLDATIERGVAPDRSSLIRLALREFVARQSLSPPKRGKGSRQ